MTSAVLRSAQAGAILTAVGLSAGLMTGVAQAEPPTHAKQECLSTSFQDSEDNPNWRDLNLRYGVQQRIIGPPPAPGSPGCRTAYKSEKWVRAIPPWITAETCALPQKDCGQETGQTPIEYFKTNFKGALYVIDANPDGTGGQRVEVGKEALQSGNVPNDVAPAGLPWAAPVSPVFDKLPVGNHYINVLVDMSKKTCNGRPDGPANDTPGLTAGVRCLEAGQNVYPVGEFGAVGAGCPDGPNCVKGNSVRGLIFSVLDK